jgi:hypothetical protein
VLSVMGLRIANLSVREWTFSKTKSWDIRVIVCVVCGPLWEERESPRPAPTPFSHLGRNLGAARRRGWGPEVGSHTKVPILGWPGLDVRGAVLRLAQAVERRTWSVAAREDRWQ